MLEEYWNILKMGADNTEQLQERISKLVSFETLAEQNEKLNAYITENATKVQLLYPGTSEVLKSFFLLLSDIDTEVARRQKNDPLAGYAHRFAVVLKLLRKSRRTLLDCISLFEHGAALSLFALWSGVFQDYVTAKFILSQDDEVARRYDEFFDEESSESVRQIGALYSWTGLKKSSQSFATLVKLTGEEARLPAYILATQYLQAGPDSINSPLVREGVAQLPAFLPEAVPMAFNLMIRTQLSFSELVTDRFLDEVLVKAVGLLTAVVAHKLILQTPEE